MFLAVDVGATKTLMSVFSNEGELQRELKFATNHSYSDFLLDFKTHLKELDVERFDYAAVAIPGTIDRNTGIGLSFGNLEWQNVPVHSDLERIIGCPVVIENDAKAGAVFEAKNVKGDFKNVVYLAFGTGIGIGNVVNGVINLNSTDRGGNRFPLEFNGQETTWEKIASGKAIVATYGKKASEITDEATWREIAQRMALGLTKVIKELEPDVVIIGGGVGSHYERFHSFLEAELEQSLETVPVLKQANKPEEAVIYGCYELAKEHYEHARS